MPLFSSSKPPKQVPALPPSTTTRTSAHERRSSVASSISRRSTIGGAASTTTVTTRSTLAEKSNQEVIITEPQKLKRLSFAGPGELAKKSASTMNFAGAGLKRHPTVGATLQRTPTLPTITKRRTTPTPQSSPTTRSPPPALKLKTSTSKLPPSQLPSANGSPRSKLPIARASSASPSLHNLAIPRFRAPNRPHNLSSPPELVALNENAVSPRKRAIEDSDKEKEDVRLKKLEPAGKEKKRPVSPLPKRAWAFTRGKNADKEKEKGKEKEKQKESPRSTRLPSDSPPTKSRPKPSLPAPAPPALPAPQPNRLAFLSGSKRSSQIPTSKIVISSPSPPTSPPRSLPSSPSRSIASRSLPSRRSPSTSSTTTLPITQSSELDESQILALERSLSLSAASSDHEGDNSFSMDDGSDEGNVSALLQIQFSPSPVKLSRSRSSAATFPLTQTPRTTSRRPALPSRNNMSYLSPTPNAGPQTSSKQPPRGSIMAWESISNRLDEVDDNLLADIPELRRKTSSGLESVPGTPPLFGGRTLQLDSISQVLFRPSLSATEAHASPPSPTFPVIKSSISIQTDPIPPPTPPPPPPSPPPIHQPNPHLLKAPSLVIESIRREWEGIKDAIESERGSLKIDRMGLSIILNSLEMI